MEILDGAIKLTSKLTLATPKSTGRQLYSWTGRSSNEVKALGFNYSATCYKYRQANMYGPELWMVEVISRCDLWQI